MSGATASPTPPASPEELGTVTTEIRRLGESVRGRLEEERDWLVRGIGLVVLAATYLQTVPLLFVIPVSGEWRVIDTGVVACTSALGLLLLLAPRWIREGFARLFRLRPPPVPAPSSVVAEAIRQVLVNEGEIEEISTLANVTSILLVVLVTIATVLGVLGLFATLSGVIPGFGLFVVALVGLGVAAAIIVVATILLLRWRHHALRELDRENAWRWGELGRLQREFWQRY
ncbi:MAG: carboxylesterase family protein [Thermoplasmata archaeon]|nr:carboxylesterase family protein [Thermoplasmata archaeon]